MYFDFYFIKWYMSHMSFKLLIRLLFLIQRISYLHLMLGSVYKK